MDDQRQAVLTATVTLRSAALQGARTAIPRDDGSYTFGQLAPGEYEIAVEAPRFASATRTTIVHHAATVELNITLRDEGAPQQPDVRRPSPSSEPAAAAYFGYDEIDRLPMARTLLGIAELAPGVSSIPGTSTIAINGAPARDTRVAVNGVDVTDNILGSPQNLYVPEAIADTTVMTSGAQAEYGRLAGGLVSTVTRDGGNRFSGGYRANLWNPNWGTRTPLELCDPAVTLASCQKAPARTGGLDAVHEATIGGYGVKDRLWFFAAGAMTDDSETSPLPLSGTSTAETVSNQRGSIKITAAVAHGQTITFDAATNLVTDTGHPSFPYTVDPNAVGKRTFPNYYYLTNYRGQIGRRAYVDGQFSTRRLEHRELGAVSAARVDSPMVTRTILTAGVPAHYNAPYFDAADPEKHNNIQGSGKLTYFLTSRRSGGHTLDGGYEFFRSQDVGGGSQSASSYVYETDFLTQADGTTPALDASRRFIPLWLPGQTLLETWLPVRGATLNVDTQSIHLQDHWSPSPRWSVDLGVRYERVHSTATNVFTHVDTRTVMPRLAVGYSLDEAHGRFVRATYGHYAPRLDEILVARNSNVGRSDVWQSVYVGPLGQGRSFTPGFDPANYLTLAGRFPASNVSIDAGLVSPVAKEFTFSYGTAFRGTGFVEATFVSRGWSHLVDEEISLANGTTHVVKKGFDVGTFTNVVYRNGDATRTYDALELMARHDVGRQWTVSGSYTLQFRNDGNDVGGEPPGATSARGNYPEIFSADRHDPGGRLATFQRHRGRVWSARQLDFGHAGLLSLSAIVRFESARSYDLIAANQPLTSIQAARLFAAGYPDRPPTQTIYFGERGSQSFKGYGLVDLAVVHRIPVVAHIQPWLKVELYNALNNRKLIAWDTTIVPDDKGPTDALGIPTTYQPAASFGKATSNLDFPTPFEGQTGGRTFRLAVGFRF